MFILFERVATYYFMQIFKIFLGKYFEEGPQRNQIQRNIYHDLSIFHSEKLVAI